MQTDLVVESHITLGYKDRQYSMCMVEGNSGCFPWRVGQGPLRPCGIVQILPSHCAFQRKLREEFRFSHDAIGNRCTFRSCVYLGSGVKCFVHDAACVSAACWRASLDVRLHRLKGAHLQLQQKLSRKKAFPLLNLCWAQTLLSCIFLRQRCSKSEALRYTHTRPHGLMIKM